MEWIQENLITIITSLLGGGSFFAFLTERNKRKIEEKQASAEALETMQKAYDKFTEDSLKRYEGVLEEVKSLKQELTEEKVKFSIIQQENAQLKIDNAKLMADNDILKNRLEDITKKLNQI